MADAARRPAVGRAASKADPAADPPWIITARISLKDQRTGPIVYPPSSKTIVRRREKAEAAARDAMAARQLQDQVQRAFRPPPGKVFGVNTAGLLLIGPAGALGTTTRMARTLAPLAAGGRHAAAVLVAAGGWQDEDALCDALAALGPKLAVLGLRICKRRAGLRIAKLKVV